MHKQSVLELASVRKNNGALRNWRTHGGPEPTDQVPGIQNFGPNMFVFVYTDE